MTWSWTRDGGGNLLGNGSPHCPNCYRKWSGNHEFIVNLPRCLYPLNEDFDSLEYGERYNEIVLGI